MDTLPLLGRIYRVTDSSNQSVSRPDLSQLSLAEWVLLLQSKNAWIRIAAQKKLVFANDESLVDAIHTIAKDEQHPLGQISALWTLEGMNALSANLLHSFSEKNEQVFSQVVVLAKSLINEQNESQFLPLFEKAIASSNYQHHLQVAHSLAKVNGTSKKEMIQVLVSKYADDPIIMDALLSSLAGQEEACLLYTSPSPRDRG